MEIRQFEYKPLSHFSYAITSGGKMALVDPERNPEMYYEYADSVNAKIVAVFETHPHADFVSSHLQIARETGAIIFASEKLGATYKHQSFDSGDTYKLGTVTLTAINTPGHSPDSITIVAEAASETALFTGDTLFVGDVGRPDLRENAGNMRAKREELAKAMFETISTKFNHLPDGALIYPAHGAGSLCGKNLSDAASSTLGNERTGNWAFKTQSEEEFVETILDSQPFIPHYFGLNVDINKDGADKVEKSVAAVPVKIGFASEKTLPLVIDTRDESVFKMGHLPNSINIMAQSANSKFETWLGSTVQPGEKFYLVVDKFSSVETLLHRTAKIGYEKQIVAVVTLGSKMLQSNPKFDLDHFKIHQSDYTIVDIRNASETEQGKFFENALTIPLHELRERAGEVPPDKPVVVHCAGGYRSAAGSSILNKELEQAKVYDLSDGVKEFSN
ncbi:MAG: MBL fold metallo-hydrolase [Leeuwenhoekiella sp.]